MLTYMRKHSRSWFIKLIFGAIIVTFVAWGGSSYLAKEQNKVAKIDKHIITIQQYSKAYSDTLRAYEQQYGNMLTPETIKMLKLNEKVLDELINSYIMAQEAKRIGLKIADAELQEAIQSVPAFVSGGAFDIERYRNILDQFQLTPQQFEDQQRQQMIRERLYDLITENVFVSKDEIEATFHERQDDYELEFVTLSPDAFTQGIVPTENEITAWYDAHKESYKVPPKTTIAYITFDAARALESVNVSTEEVQDFYDNHKADYTIPAKVRARQIIINVPPDADEKVFAAKQQEAKILLEQAKTAPDFAALAKAKSQDPLTAAGGGDLGLLDKTKLPEGLADTLFSMQPGDIRGPVRIEKGFAIVKVEEKVDARERKLEEVMGQVMQTLKERKAMDAVYNEANKAFTAIYEDPKQDIAAYAQRTGLALKSFGPFSENEQLALPMGSKIAKEAFSRPVGDLGDLVETGNGFILYKVMDRTQSRIPELKEVRTRVLADLTTDKARQAAKKRGQEIAGMTIEQRVALNPETTGMFKRATWVIPKLGANSRIKQDLDSLKTPKVYDLQGKVAVVWLKQVQKADPAKLGANESKAIREELLRRKKQLVFETFMDTAKARHTIVIDRNKIL